MRYPSIPRLLLPLFVEITKNNLPTFEPKLPPSATIQMTKTPTPTPWTFSMPKIFDKDNDQVTLSADFGYASNFLRLAKTTIEIEDIREGGLTPIR